MASGPDWRGKTLVAIHGATIGRIVDVLVGEDGQAEWLAVDTGARFRSQQRLVPVSVAVTLGTAVMVPYDEDQVRSAPQAIPVNGALSLEERLGLIDHYRLG